MKKRNSLFYLINGMGLLITAVIFCFFIVSITYFNHSEADIVPKDIEWIDSEKMVKRYAYFKNDDLFLLIFYQEPQEKTYLLELGYQYHHRYWTDVYMEVQNGNEIWYLNFSNDIATISK